MAPLALRERLRITTVRWTTRVVMDRQTLRLTSRAMPAVSGHTTDTIQHSRSPGVLQGNLDCFVLQATAMSLIPTWPGELQAGFSFRQFRVARPGHPLHKDEHRATSRGSSQGHYELTLGIRKTMKPRLRHHLPIANRS
jgi:hypothetical protein